MKFSRLLADGIANDFVTTVLPIVRYVLFFLVVACAMVMIVCALMQSNDSDGSLDVMTGAQESYYSQNKGSSRDGKLKIITTVMAITIFVCIIACLVIGLFVNVE